jgi:hypothetical protein
MNASEGSNQSEAALEREKRWRKKLRRLRFGAEPLEVQVEKYRRTTIALTVVPSFIGLMVLAIFTAFRRPDIGLVAVLVIFMPMISLAWFDFWLLARRVEHYQREKAGLQPQPQPQTKA